MNTTLSTPELLSCTILAVSVACCVGLENLRALADITLMPAKSVKKQWNINKVGWIKYN